MSAGSYYDQCEQAGRPLDDDETALPAGAQAKRFTYESRSARILREHQRGNIVWSPQAGWHDGPAR
jgi:hypothetical protein